MLTQSLAAVVLAVALSSGSAFLALWCAANLWPGRPDRGPDDHDTGVAFVFDGSALVDANAGARAMLSLARAPIGDRSGILALLSSRFPGLGPLLEKLGPAEERQFFSVDRSEIAVARRQGARLRLTLAPTEDPENRVDIDRATFLAMERELATLRSTTDHTPFLVWRQAADGAITWVNRAYLEACQVFGDPARQGLWPPCRLFDIEPDQLAGPGHKSMQRMRLTSPGGSESAWYQFHVTALGDDFLISAVNSDRVVEAEESLRTFVQTLSKTFADLPIGLAVFTKDRRLALFNPALADLTTIAPEKLILRPTIFGFFDMLRDAQMMPEPKNYATWRGQIVDLEAAAANGTYQDTWHLPYGRTFRVTGRPQIDGAVALLFEDISDEIGQSRRFRTEVEVGQSVLDSFDDAIAVFAPNGVLTLTNASYDRLWAVDTRERLEILCIADAVKSWSARTAPNPVWSRAQDFVRSDEALEPWSADAMLLDGRALICAFRTVAGGSTMVSFTVRSGRKSVSGATGFSTRRRQVAAHS